MLFNLNKYILIFVVDENILIWIYIFNDGYRKRYKYVKIIVVIKKL